MVISIHQPDYISYLGYFYKMSKADIFVYLDDCQFSNNNMHHWNRIKTPQGEQRLKIPVEQHLGDAICQVRTRDALRWKEKHLKAVEMNYKKARFFDAVFPLWKELLTKCYGNLADMNITINTEIGKAFGFKTKFLRSSDMEIKTLKEERVIEIVKLLEGDTYLSGLGAKAYETEEHFTKCGIRLLYTDFSIFEYPQLWPKAGFLPYMSILDYIFNCGFDWEYVEYEIRKRNGKLY